MQEGDVVEVYDQDYKLIKYCYSDESGQYWIAIQPDATLPCDTKLVYVLLEE